MSSLCILLCLCFSLSKSGKTYLRPMMPPGDRMWQLIYPDSEEKIKAVGMGLTFYSLKKTI